LSGLVRRRLSSRIGMLGVAVVVATGAFAGSAPAQGLPPQEPGAWDDAPKYGDPCTPGKIASDGSAVAFFFNSIRDEKAREHDQTIAIGQPVVRPFSQRLSGSLAKSAKPYASVRCRNTDGSRRDGR